MNKLKTFSSLTHGSTEVPGQTTTLVSGEMGEWKESQSESASLELKLLVPQTGSCVEVVILSNC